MQSIGSPPPSIESFEDKLGSVMSAIEALQTHNDVMSKALEAMQTQIEQMSETSTVANTKFSEVRGKGGGEREPGSGVDNTGRVWRCPACRASPR